jgi:PKD repeat protein
MNSKSIKKKVIIMEFEDQPHEIKQKRKLKKRKSKLPNVNPSPLRNRRSIKAIVIALYLTFLLLSAIPFLADRTVEPVMKDSYEYHLKYPKDGRQSHYYVERVDINKIGTIDLTYTTESNLLDVEANNIKVLHIYCRSMYEDESEKVFGIDPADNSNYYKWYFIEKNHFIAKVQTDNEIEELSFIDMPIPYKVIVNGLKLVEGRQYHYKNNHGIIISDVPKGNSLVDIYFRPNDLNKPVAKFSTDKEISNVNTLINFDASESDDIDGTIEAYIWDFGDGTNSGGVVNAHTYSNPGVYGVILTVRDNDFLIDHAFLNITIVKGDNKPVINGIIPDQIKMEDEDPWTLDLKGYGIDLDSSPSELEWYLTGENLSLYKVVGENGTGQKLVFSPESNAFGNDSVTIWLTDKDGNYDTQPLWINITSVNDKPIIDNLPNLVVHHSVPYRFNITHYIHDVETPVELLLVSAQDKYGNQYVIVEGKEIVFEYPESLLRDIVIVTITVSDGEDYTEAITTVEITTDWPPLLLKNLPDIEIYEGTTEYDAFNLDDYFVDPDGEDLYYSYSDSHVIIFVKGNKSVDFISTGEWTGDEMVIFRARDSAGAFEEDVINVRVLPINDPPEIAKLPDIMVHFDMDYTFDLSYYIHDSDNNASELTLTTSDPEHIRISPIPDDHLSIILNYPKSMLGITSNVVVTVSDGLLTASSNLSVLVIPEYPPELIKKIPDITFNEDESLINYIDLDNHFLDYDNDSLYYTTGNVKIQIDIDENHLVSLSALKNWSGVERVIFRATDPIGALVEAPILITVIPINDPPVLLPIEKIVINETEIYQLNLADYIIDIDTNLSNINVIVEDPNVMVSGTSLVIFGSSELPKEVDIYLNDGDLTTVGMLEIQVNIDKPPTNDVNSKIILLSLILVIIIITILITLLYMYRKEQKFNIDEIFLIHNSGKLINHTYYKAHSRFDDEIFSGMFTAIQEFIEDSFSGHDLESQMLSRSKGKSTSQDASPKGSLKLNEFKAGDNQVIIEHGEFIFMAVVYNGRGARTLHRVVNTAIQSIEKKYAKHLDYWSGDMKPFESLQADLEKLFPQLKTERDHKNEDEIEVEDMGKEKLKGKVKKRPKPRIHNVVRPTAKIIKKSKIIRVRNGRVKH